MAWVAVRAIGSSGAARSGPGVTPSLYAEMSLLRNTLLQNMREEAPVNKNPSAKNRGALRRSLRASPWETDGRHWRAEFSAADYIKYVIKDTRPHRISAKPGSVLALTWSGKGGVSGLLNPVSFLSRGGVPGTLGRKGGPSIFRAPGGYAALRGGVMFVRFVNHPGTKANNFVKRAVDKTFVMGVPGFTRRVQQAIASELIQLVTAA